MFLLLLTIAGCNTSFGDKYIIHNLEIYFTPQNVGKHYVVDMAAYFRENDLKPTPAHSLYSLRHTFKDRLRDAGAPEEVIDELMGHKKSGPKYGRGHMLENKYEWLKRIEFSVL